MLLTFSKWSSKSSVFFFHFSCKHQKVTSCAAQIPSFPSQLSCLVVERSVLLVDCCICVPPKASSVFNDLIKYLVKCGSFYVSNELVAEFEPAPPSSPGKQRAGFIHRTGHRWKPAKDLREAEKAAMEARRRGKSMQESILDRIYLSSSGTEEHFQVLKTRQWLDKSCWNSSWMRLNGLSCWRHVGMLTGLTLAGVIGFFQAWYVYSIHENLLWFSQLEVRRTTLMI